MPPQVYEELLQLSCSILEPVPLTRENASAFPFVSLRPTGAYQSKEFTTYVLENEYLRAEVCPQLGGRLIALHDKRDQTSPILRPQTLEVVSEGPRGVAWPHGLQVAIEGRLNDLGPLDAFPRAPEDDNQPAAVFIHDVHGDVSWHGCWSLSSGRAELTLEIRAFNRGLLPVDFHADLQGDGDFRILAEASSQTLLLPRRTAVFTFRIVPASGFGATAIWGRSGVAEIEGGAIRFRSTSRRAVASLRIVGSTQTVEAQAELNPEVELASELPDIGVLERIKVEDEIIAIPPAFVSRPSSLEEAWRNPEFGTAEAELVETARRLWNDPLQELSLAAPSVPGGEHLALLLQAFGASRNAEYSLADELLEKYLGFNAEDHLAWWLRSVLAARIRPDSAENPEALNAHFLAPLEPILRVQSFLAQGQGQGREANPLMRPLALDVDACVDAVHQLLLAGLNEEAHRLLDELLRHRPAARPHILAAWLFLRKTRMAFEAAHHAASAAALPPEPPFPHRAFEYQALRDLASAHPLPGLQPWLALEAFALPSPQSA